MSSSSGFFGAWLSITPPKTYCTLYTWKPNTLCFHVFFLFQLELFVSFTLYICPPRNLMEIPILFRIQNPLTVWVPPMGTSGEIPSKMFVEAILCVIKRRCPKYPIPKVCHKTPGRSLPKVFFV